MNLPTCTYFMQKDRILFGRFMHFTIFAFIEIHIIRDLKYNYYGYQ